ncbi:hypothetical protein [Nostoc sp. T09]|nr:hypothetical protein [Nostoc sp. T09]
MAKASDRILAVPSRVLLNCSEYLAAQSINQNNCDRYNLAVIY